MYKIKNLLWLLLAAILFSIPGCNNDDEVVDQNRLIVGLWESTEVRMTFTVGQLTLQQYYIDELGLTEEESDEVVQLYGNNFASGLIGFIEFKEDKTFSSTLGSNVETGTWWILNDTSLKLTEVSMADQVDLTIVSLDASKLILGFEDTNSDDINEDGMDEIILIQIELVLDKTTQGQ